MWGFPLHAQPCLHGATVFICSLETIYIVRKRQVPLQSRGPLGVSLGRTPPRCGFRRRQTGAARCPHKDLSVSYYVQKQNKTTHLPQFFPPPKIKDALYFLPNFPASRFIMN